MPALLPSAALLWLSTAADLTFLGGAEVNASPHGIANLAYQDGPWSVALITDTLDLRWSPEGQRGRAWLAVRGEVASVGVLNTPWQDGAPVAGFNGFYAGTEGGAVRYGRDGWYAGAAGMARQVWFTPGKADPSDVPDNGFWGSAEGLLGRWSPTFHVWMRAGVQHDGIGARVQPHAALTATTAFSRTWAPRAEVRAAWADGQSVLTATRVGGLNPYVVPIAGAGWGEWWAESYAAVRLGPQATWNHNNSTWSHAVVVDAAALQDVRTTEADTVWGIGALQRWSGERWYVAADIGLGAGVKRASGDMAMDALVLVGTPSR